MANCIAIHAMLTVAIVCPNLDDPLYGSVTLSGNRVGDTATYKCDAGFTLSGGDRVRTCGANGVTGVWSGKAPVCIRKKTSYCSLRQSYVLL